MGGRVTKIGVSISTGLGLFVCLMELTSEFIFGAGWTALYQFFTLIMDHIKSRLL